jgi:hypothetical protein
MVTNGGNGKVKLATLAKQPEKVMDHSFTADLLDVG